ncbi:MAG: hypothetical protein QM727_14475 [Niabella sp.]
MKHFIFIVAIFFVGTESSIAQPHNSLWQCPVVDVTAKLAADTLTFGREILVTITLTNKSQTTKSVWFDKPQLNTGGPAATSVKLTNRKTGESVLKYENKAILISQAYTNDQIKSNAYLLKPGDNISGEFSLYSLVVLPGNKKYLDKGDYEMQVFYCKNKSDKLCFSVN